MPYIHKSSTYSHPQKLNLQYILENSTYSTSTKTQPTVHLRKLNLQSIHKNSTYSPSLISILYTKIPGQVFLIMSKNTGTCSVYGHLSPTLIPNNNSKNCSMTWKVNFTISHQDTINIITMLDFIFDNCDSTEKTKILKKYIFTMWSY